MPLLETPARIEPCGIEENIPEPLADLVLTIQSEAQDIGRSLHPDSAAELRGMTRVMNAYYSNLIEGHNTRPADIEAALEGRLDEVENRPLAEEAVAHVRVQEWIDGEARESRLPDPFSVDFLRDVHRRFYTVMPDDLRFVMHGDQCVEIIPGAFRLAGQEVRVGRHAPPSAHRLDDFMGYFEMRYRGLARGPIGRILSIPAMHHRLNYIHPFLDGNGRVSRLMTHAMIQKAGIGGHGLWSVSRGLARGLRERGEYMDSMERADQPRRGDRDGRGNLSLGALEHYTAWFLTVMLDQIRFTSAMLDIKGLQQRYGRLLKDLHPENPRLGKVAIHALKHGEIARSDLPVIAGVKERAARNDLSTLLKEGFLKSAGHREPVRIGFPLHYRERLFPNLFTDAAIEIPEPPELPRL